MTRATGAQLIAEFGGLKLTSERVRQFNRVGFTSVLLDKVDGVAIRRTHHPWLLWGAALAGGIGIALAFAQCGRSAEETEVAGMLLFVGLLAFFAYVRTRSVALWVFAGRLTLTEAFAGSTAGAKHRRAAERFAEALEAARIAYAGAASA